jgi:glycosidase
VKKEYRKGLAVNRNKDWIKQIPADKFNSPGKLVITGRSDILGLVQILKENLKSHNLGITAGELNAVITISEMSCQVIQNYSLKYQPDLFLKLSDYLSQSQGETCFYNFLQDYCHTFLKPDFESDNQTYRQFVLHEIIINWLNNINPAMKAFYPIIDNSPIRQKSANLVVVLELVNYLNSFDHNQDDSNSSNLGLYELLRLPATKYPHSLRMQLEHILLTWNEFLDDTLPVLHSIDLLKEEESHFTGDFPPPPVPDYDQSILTEFEEYYSDDSDWMPSLVLLAKSVYVWLHQLSYKHGYLINKLDQIPDSELELLQRRGFTGLWLIGIWQRSKASKKIKSHNGDTHAIASAYSLAGYRIAQELGGDIAWDILTQKAARFKIKLGCDMVPNHTGIDSDWIFQHPEWFIQRNDLPFSSYRFNGENLSQNQEVEIRIEDHYYAKTDAAVVFEHYHVQQNRRRYIYHGNDGTGLPWNDTAQLDYTQKQVRQAVLSEITQIAKRIPIIRFDAAMTLAKKHYQRLWFPAPGSGGDIPTRSEYSLNKEEFNRLFPREFWRDVVDTVAIEAPHTLLLAEAFWMMEGYFVRNLGMHRVYNSAFMHMMMRQDNAAFRQTITNTLKYDKRILKRFVNFMSNPDEDTAISQFGDDDKYFGVCVLMSTLPGLPMFGHGQIEGFREKYGMEFAAPRLNETENSYLVKRHEKEIFPLLRRRKLFADADNFRLLDFICYAGNINENVIAFYNYNHGVHSLVIYNNDYSTIEGSLNYAGSYGEDINRPETIGKILGLCYGQNRFLIFRDLVDNLEYIRPCDEILTSGFKMILNGFQYHAFAFFREEIDDADQRLSRIYKNIGRDGTDSLENVNKRIKYLPLHSHLKALFSYGMISNQELLISGQITDAREQKFFLTNELFPAIISFHSTFMEIENFIPWTEERLIGNMIKFFRHAKQVIIRHKPACPVLPPSSIISAWVLCREIEIRAKENNKTLPELIDKYLLTEPFQEIFTHRCNGILPKQCLDIMFAALKYENFWETLLKEDVPSLHLILQDKNIKNIIRVHEFAHTQWFNKEAFLALFAVLEIVNRIARAENTKKKILPDLEEISRIFGVLYKLSSEVNYNYDKLLDLSKKYKGE